MRAALRASLFALLLTIWSAGLAPALASTLPPTPLQILLDTDDGEVPTPAGTASFARTIRQQARMGMPVQMMPAPALRHGRSLPRCGGWHDQSIASTSTQRAFQRQHRGRAPPC